MVNKKFTQDDRRSVRRYNVKIEILWEGKVGRQNGTLGDISSLGCFVLCSGEVENGELIKLFLPIGDGMKAEFKGKVVNHFFEIGFGVEFFEMNKSQKEYVEKMIKFINKNRQVKLKQQKQK